MPARLERNEIRNSFDPDQPEIDPHHNGDECEPWHLGGAEDNQDFVEAWLKDKDRAFQQARTRLLNSESFRRLMAGLYAL